MRNRIVTIVLAVGLLFSLGALLAGHHGMRLPGNQQGYAPRQPIAFSHRLHAGELQISCFYCHYAAQTSRHAGIPAASICMNCHRFVTAPLGAIRAEDEQAKQEKRKPRRVVSAEIQKIYDALALDADLKPIPGKARVPIAWIKVHNLPDFVYFDHRAHITAGVACQRCHGAVETMERVFQVESLAMGWCVNCHRKVNAIGVGGRRVHAPTDCATCHY